MTNDIDGAPSPPPSAPQATAQQRQAIYKLIVNDPAVVRELVRGLSVDEADAVLAALTAAHARVRPAIVHGNEFSVPLA